MRGFGKWLVGLQAILELESFLFLLHDFHAGVFWQVFLPLAAHFLAVALLAIGFVHPWNFSRPADRAWAVTGMCLVLPLPLLGFLGFVALYSLITSGPRSRGELLKDFQEYIAYDPTANPVQRHAGDHFLADEVDVAPLRETLAGTDVNLKRGAILSLSRLPRAEAVILLKGALSDPSREIRYYASHALSDMEKEFNDRIFRLVREIERSPTSVERHVELARIVLDYTESGLLDEGMIGHFLDVGLRALDKAVLVAAVDPRVDLLAAHLRSRTGELERAESHIDRYLAAVPSDIDAVLFAAELSFERGDLARARDLLSSAAERFPDDRRLADLRSVVAAKVGEAGA